MPRASQTPQTLSLDDANTILTTTIDAVVMPKERKVDKLSFNLVVLRPNGLTKALDELGKVHPFIMIAVTPFKVALALERKRAENDKRVIALFVQMNDMMETLRLQVIKIIPLTENLAFSRLEHIDPAELGSGGEKLDEYMKDRLSEAAKAITECSHATHEYYKMKLIPKLIRSGKWENKFTEYAQIFAGLHMLSVNTSLSLRELRFNPSTELLKGLTVSVLMKMFFASF
ncbi:hypothetical protein CPB84DRAFT_1846604 [Gymnopilus junonius]|uniref:Uncharacterized protein n=1 Tax=Gymnopilus junonius TaxID=109634 RepID=A0A9P5NQ85_GYMJU|nr:hypothetical protein CPB84DRAFT_1846604 [Gymnopilus junonius]